MIMVGGSTKGKGRPKLALEVVGLVALKELE